MFSFWIKITDLYKRKKGIKSPFRSPKARRRSRTRRIITYKEYISLLVVFFGLILIAYGLSSKASSYYLKVTSPEPVIADSRLMSGQLNEDKIPVSIRIDDLSIDLEIRPASVFDSKWQVFDDTAAYGLGSGIPGEVGNVVVFAHARWGLFFPLRNAKEGMDIEITTKEDKKYLYNISQIIEVLPNEIEVLKPTEDEILTLYTCSGFNDQKRLIVKAIKV